jgi:hypothetical protein
MLEEPTLMRDICFLDVWMFNHWADLSCGPNMPDHGPFDHFE